MNWFKHYTNAEKGIVLQELYAYFGVNEGYGLYFRFVSYLVDKWDGISEPKFKVYTKKLQKYLGISPKKWQIFAKILTDSSQISFIFSEDFCEICFPKLLEIRNKDSKGGRIARTSYESRARVRSKKKEVRDRVEDTIQPNVISAAERFELGFNKDFVEFKKWITEAVGFTPSFGDNLPKIYERWKNNKADFQDFIDGRKSAVNETSLKTDSERQSWIRRAIILESGIEGA